jgi:uncharacterized phage protein gp47/JayE
MTRGEVTASLSGAAMVANSVLRVMSDTMAGLAHLTLRYIDWLSNQMLPDTAETEWLDRHGAIWLKNSDGTVGRKGATYAEGTVNFTGIQGATLDKGVQITAANRITYETTQQVFIDGTLPTPCTVRALTPGVASNMIPGDPLALTVAIAGIDSQATVVVMEGGTDQESDDDLRTRIILRIQNPPMGGCMTDYVEWTLAYPGVTRAWCYPLEMGIGTVTVRFMMDDLRATDEGFPDADDVANVAAWLDVKRPVAVKDFFLEAPVPYPIDFTVYMLKTDNPATRAAIADSVTQMLKDRLRPGDTVYRSWVDEAISAALGEDHHELVFVTTPMAAPGYLAVLGNITYTTTFSGNA